MSSSGRWAGNGRGDTDPARGAHDVCKRGAAILSAARKDFVIFTTELLVIVALVLANGFFSGAEIAIIALRRQRMQEMAEEGRGGAHAVLTLREHPERFLATVQVGITVVSATAAAFGGDSIAERLASRLAKIDWIGERAGAVALTLVIAGVSYLSIVLGELVPKSLALRGAERFALIVGRPLLLLSWMARPLAWFLSASANVLLKPFGDSTTFTETRHSVAELQELVEDAAKAGTIHPDAGEIASRALDLTQLTAADVMVPRQDVVAIPREASLDDLRRILIEQTHARLPVYENVVDHVVGYISLKDALALVLGERKAGIEDIVRAGFFVPATKHAVDLLRDMRKERVPFAIVVDETGGMSGIVTMEDLLEELVGEIYSEHSTEASTALQRDADGSVLLSGGTPVREVKRLLGIDLPESDDWSTVAGLCLALAGRVPVTGECVRTEDGIVLEIVDASPRRIRTVRLTAPPAPSWRPSASPRQ